MKCNNCISYRVCRKKNVTKGSKACETSRLDWREMKADVENKMETAINTTGDPDLDRYQIIVPEDVIQKLRMVKNAKGPKALREMYAWLPVQDATGVIVKYIGPSEPEASA